MPIHLKIVFPQDVPPDLKDIPFDTSGGRIGRSDNLALNNDWVLPDEDREISKAHATIDYRDKVYYIKDHSANGTYIQHEGQKAFFGGHSPENEERQLANGDKLFIGKYQIEVTIEDEAENVQHQITDKTELPQIDNNVVSEHAPQTDSSLISNNIVGGEQSSSVVAPSDKESSSIHKNIVSGVESSAVSENAPTSELIDNQVAIRAFLEGAGLKEADIAIGQLDPSLMKTLGISFREVVNGMIELLDGRQQFKYHIAQLDEGSYSDQTVLGPENNNALKHIRPADLALKMMLEQKKGYLPIDEAISEGLKEIKIHQFSMASSLRSSVKKTLDSLSPEKIEKETQRGILKNSTSKNWKEFVRRYHTINADDLSDRELAKAYKEWTKRLKAHL